MITRPPAVRDAAGTGSGKITRELVLSTALKLIDRDGADALSMRRPDWAAQLRAAELERGLDILLTGLATTLSRQA